MTVMLCYNTAQVKVSPKQELQQGLVRMKDSVKNVKMNGKNQPNTCLIWLTSEGLTDNFKR